MFFLHICLLLRRDRLVSIVARLRGSIPSRGRPIVMYLQRPIKYVLGAVSPGAKR
jgi:hypothetical protein